MNLLTRRNVLCTLVMLTAALAVTLSACPARASIARPHERIDAAIRALDDAKEELDRADHDFGGRRVEAMKKIGEAKDALEHSRDHGLKKSEAEAKIEEAKGQLERCEEFKGPHDKEESAEKRHPRIHKAIEALVAAREEL